MEKIEKLIKYIHNDNKQNTHNDYSRPIDYPY